MRQVLRLIAFAYLIAGSPVAAQGRLAIRVAMDIEDSAANRSVSRELASELRRLGDVEIVKTLEPADILLGGQATCSNCATGQILVALRLAKPYGRLDAQRLLVFRPNDLNNIALLDSLMDSAVVKYARFEEPVGMWVFSWRSADLNQNVRSFVSQINRDCLESIRLTKQFLAVSHPSSSLMERMKKSEVLC